MDIKLTLELKGKEFKMDTGREVTFVEVTEMLINGLMVAMEQTLKKSLEQKGNKLTEEEMRSQIHDLVVITFSTAMNVFDPKAVDYKTAAEDGGELL